MRRPYWNTIHEFRMRLKKRPPPKVQLGDGRFAVYVVYAYARDLWAT
ncbi:MAG: hypothetical protein HOZ81_51555 [Streptomyces sp.]|nr:hypothetical protein [Streptomyces sp.]